mmetsp:Transcript_18271/g.46065  ORF Transcript_18271/g.46065 Transcript_18271/m.46065 type:complete len:85 (-) Transcript_18271:60-314(-)
MQKRKHGAKRSRGKRGSDDFHLHISNEEPEGFFILKLREQHEAMRYRMIRAPGESMTLVESRGGYTLTTYDRVVLECSNKPGFT